MRKTSIKPNRITAGHVDKRIVVSGRYSIGFIDVFQRLRKKSSSSSLSSAVIQKRKENMPLMTGKSSCNEDTLTPISRKRLTVPSWVFLRYRNSSFISRSSAATGSGSSPLAMGPTRSHMKANGFHRQPRTSVRTCDISSWRRIKDPI